MVGERPVSDRYQLIGELNGPHPSDGKWRSPTTFQESHCSTTSPFSSKRRTEVPESVVSCLPHR